MKKLITLLLIVTLSFFTLTSCVTTVEAQDGVYTTTVIDIDDIEMAIVYGTPYIVNGVVLYYLYNNLYYYPFYTRGHYYYNVYARPLARYPRYWQPVPRNHWFRDGRYHNPHGFVGHHKDRPRIHSDRPRPNAGKPQPNIRNHRESSTRQTPPPNNRVFGNGQNRNVTPQRSTPPNRTFGGSSVSRPSGGSRPSSAPSRSSGGGHFGGRR